MWCRPAPACRPPARVRPGTPPAGRRHHLGQGQVGLAAAGSRARSPAARPAAHGWPRWSAAARLQPLAHQHQHDHGRASVQVAAALRQPHPHRQAPARRGADGHQQVHVAGARLQGMPAGLVEARPARTAPAWPAGTAARPAASSAVRQLADHGQHQRQRQQQADRHRREAGPGGGLPARAPRRSAARSRHCARHGGSALRLLRGAKVTRADSVARFTTASLTPGTFFSARSTRLTQEAQVIPATPRSRVAGAVVAVSMAMMFNLAMRARSSLDVDQLERKGLPAHDHHGGKVHAPCSSPFRERISP